MRRLRNCWLLSVALLFTKFVVSQSCVVKSVTYEGLKKTKVSFLDQFCKGDINNALDSNRIEQNVRFLKRLPSFSNVEFKVRVFGNECEVAYIFEENFTTMPGLAVLQSIDAVTIRPFLTESNFLGRNITVSGFYQYNLFHSFYLGSRAPFLFNKSTGLEANAQRVTTLEPLYIDGESAIYRYQLSNVELLLVKTLALRHILKTGVSYFNDDYKIYRKGITINDFVKTVNLNKYSVKLDYQFSNINWHFYLPSGINNYFGAQLVNTIGFEESTLALYNQFSAFKSDKRNNTLAARLAIGFTTSVPSPFAPFAIDNNLNLRGVGNIIRRASSLLVLNNEYRITMFEKKQFVVQSNMFIDAGTWRRFGQTAFFKREDSDIMVGLGIRALHKRIFNAILRVDYGWSLLNNGRGFVFGVGQYF